MIIKHTVITALNDNWGDFALVINNFLSNPRHPIGNMNHLKFGFLCFETEMDK